MGKYNTSTNNIVQTLPGIFPPNGSSGSEPGNFSSPVYFGGYVFFARTAATSRASRLTNGLLSTSATLRSTSIFPDRGAALARPRTERPTASSGSPSAMVKERPAFSSRSTRRDRRTER